MNKNWNSIKEDIDRIIKIKGAVEGRTIHTDALAAKEAELKNTMQLRKYLANMIADIDNRIDGLHKSIIVDQMSIVSTLSKCGIKADIENETPAKRSLSIAPLTLSHNNTAAVVPTRLMTDVQITPTMSLTAVAVRDFESVSRDGSLHYVSPHRCFAIHLNGVLYRGNIGRVFGPAERTPTKIKECRFGAKCSKMDKCEYYHGPPDVRNHVAIGRKFGSRDTLDIDIMKVAPEDVRKSADLLMHDILCGLLLQKYKSF